MKAFYFLLLFVLNFFGMQLEVKKNDNKFYQGLIYVYNLYKLNNGIVKNNKYKDLMIFLSEEYFRLSTEKNLNTENKEFFKKKINEKDKDYINNLGNSFGNIYLENKALNLNVFSSINILKLLKNSNFKKCNLFSVGRGGLNELVVSKLFENIIANDTTDLLLSDFESRMGKKINNKFIGNMFEVFQNNQEKFDYILISNSLHYYNSRNISSLNNHLYNKKILDLILNLSKNLENYGMITVISACDNFAINLTKRSIESIKNNSNFNFFEKINFFNNSIDKINKIMKDEKLKWIEAKNKYLNKYELSEKLNLENEFVIVSLFPHDIFHKEIDIKIIQELKNKFYKIKIEFINTGEFFFKKEIILDSYKDDELLFILRENPLTFILNQFKEEKELNYFLKSNDKCNREQKFGFQYDFF